MSVTRLWVFAWREWRELWRDRFRLWSALLMPVLLFLVLGFGLSLDVEDLKYAVLDRDATPASRSYLEPFAHSRSFDFQGTLASPAELERALVAGDVTLVIDVPHGYHRDLVRGRPPAVAFWIDGTLPFRAEVASGYVNAMHRAWMATEAREDAAKLPVVETRFWYNPGLRSALAFAPGLIAVLLVMFAPLVAAMGVAREKELGTIVNLFATPLSRLEFLLGKQIPYVVLTLFQFVLLVVLARIVFRVPVRGDLPSLLLVAVLYAGAVTGLGVLVGSFARSQIEALLITLILTLLPAWLFSGLFHPVTGLSGAARAISLTFPTTYGLHAFVAVMTKGLGWSAVGRDAGILLLFALGLTLAAFFSLKEQAP